MCSIEEPVLVPEEKPTLGKTPSKTTQEGGNTAGGGKVPASQLCCKCKVVPPCVFVRRALFCKACFQDSVVHRFRTCIQKSRHVKDGDKIMIACSGGPSSRTLLHAVHDFHNVSARQRQKFSEIIVCHIDESCLLNPSSSASTSASSTLSTEVEEVVRGYGFKLVSVPLENVFDDSNSESVRGEEKSVKVERLRKCLEAISKMSSKEDSVNHFKMQLLVKAARENGCRGLFVGDNATRIAIKAISQTSKGRGYSMPLDIGNEAAWFTDVTILRPLKEVLSKEIGIFNHYQSIQIHPAATTSVTTKMPAKASIDRLTEEFIVGLQRDYPSTINTIVRTISKVSTGYHQEEEEPLTGKTIKDGKKDGSTKVKAGTGGKIPANARRCPLCGGPVRPGADLWRSRHTIKELPQSHLPTPEGTSSGTKTTTDSVPAATNKHGHDVVVSSSRSRGCCQTSSTSGTDDSCACGNVNDSATNKGGADAAKTASACGAGSCCQSTNADDVDTHENATFGLFCYACQNILQDSGIDADGKPVATKSMATSTATLSTLTPLATMRTLESALEDIFPPYIAHDVVKESQKRQEDEKRRRREMMRDTVKDFLLDDEGSDEE
ncbi:Cytoplasmic tRNA 2-thiolation protein 2 [Quaeritorhiza haematococci]|nr:Cytoplasmic tRNA 2-thiolation protein 2 [Quaeritorhiza haematococci]